MCLQQNEELKSLVDQVDTEKKSFEVKLQELTELYNQLSKERDAEAFSALTLDAELNAANAEYASLTKQMSSAGDEIAHLSQFKDQTVQSLSALTGLRSDVDVLATDTRSLTQLFTSATDVFVEWRDRTQSQHFNEVEKLEETLHSLNQDNERLSSVVEESERAKSEAKSSVALLEKKIGYMQQTADNATSSRIGEKLSWEKAMEEMKAQHRKEKVRLSCRSQDEQDILNNTIVNLEAELSKVKALCDQKCQVMETEYLHQIDGINATLSKLKYESALDVQHLSKEKDTLSQQLSSTQAECSSLSRSIESMEQHLLIVKKDHCSELEISSHARRRDLDEAKRLFQQKEETLLHDIARLTSSLFQSEKEKEIAQKSTQVEIARRNDDIASERSTLLQQLRELKRELCDIRASVSLQIDDVNCDWEYLCSNVISDKLTSMRQSYTSLIEIQRDETIKLQASQSDELSQLKEQVSSASKEADDAKRMLFQTIREAEDKLEREVRHLNEDHSLKLSTMTNESKSKCDELTAKFQDLCKEFESVANSNAATTSAVAEKDTEIRDLKMKLSDLTKSHDNEVRSICSQHQSERASLLRDMLTKESIIQDQFTKEKSHLQDQLNDVSQQLKDAKEKWGRILSTGEKDAEQIKSLYVCCGLWRFSFGCTQ